MREQLTEWGIDISAGQIDALLTAGKEDFFAEKDALLVAGLEVSRAITVDDSGARHRGKSTKLNRCARWDNSILTIPLSDRKIRTFHDFTPPRIARNIPPVIP